MSIQVEGYGGQYRTYATGYTRNNLSIPPRVPREYSTMSANDDCTKLVFRRKITITTSRGPVGWQRMNTIYSMRYPIGFHGFDKDGMIGRGLGYIPLIAISAGWEEIIESIKMIYKRVILNENSISEWEDASHEDAILRTHRIVPVELCASQRLVILLNAIGIFFRGVITLGQIGLVFIPFDSCAD